MFINTDTVKEYAIQQTKYLQEHSRTMEALMSMKLVLRVFAYPFFFVDLVNNITIKRQFQCDTKDH